MDPGAKRAVGGSDVGVFWGKLKKGVAVSKGADIKVLNK